MFDSIIVDQLRTDPIAVIQVKLSILFRYDPLQLVHESNPPLVLVSTETTLFAERNGSLLSRLPLR
jgi:hypothetical protein